MNYPDELVEVIVEAYKASPSLDTVKALAKEHNKSQRSLVAKLSSLGVYQTANKEVKEPAITKAQIVATIETKLSIKTTTLIKAGKQDLIKIQEALADDS